MQLDSIYIQMATHATDDFANDLLVAMRPLLLKYKDSRPQEVGILTVLSMVGLLRDDDPVKKLTIAAMHAHAYQDAAIALSKIDFKDGV